MNAIQFRVLATLLRKYTLKERDEGFAIMKSGVQGGSRLPASKTSHPRAKTCDFLMQLADSPCYVRINVCPSPDPRQLSRF